MMSLKHIELPVFTLTDLNHLAIGLTCEACGALVRESRKAQHEEFHASVAGWLRDLRDGKADA